MDMGQQTKFNGIFQCVCCGTRNNLYMVNMNGVIWVCVECKKYEPYVYYKAKAWSDSV
jgi:hypothetical protein